MFDLPQQVKCLLLYLVEKGGVQLPAGLGGTGFDQPLEHGGANQLLEGVMDRLQEGFPQRFLDARHAAPVQIGCQVGVVAPLVVLHLAEVVEDVIFVRAQLDVKPLFPQLRAGTNVLQSADVIAENAKPIVLMV